MRLIAYPFVVCDGTRGTLTLPAEGLDPHDADRLIEFVRSLTIPNGARESEAGT